MNTNNTPNRILPIIAMVIGVFLVLGGLAFALGSSFISVPNVPLAFTIAPAIQVAMGLTAVASSVLLLRGFHFAKWILLVVIGVLFANWVYLIAAAVPFVKASVAS